MTETTADHRKAMRHQYSKQGEDVSVIGILDELEQVEKERDSLRSDLRVGVDFWEEYQQARTQLEKAVKVMEKQSCPHQQWFINKGVKHVTHEATCAEDKKCRDPCPRCAFLASLEEHD